MSVQQAVSAGSRSSGGRPQGLFKAYVASLTGTSLEYYDFAIYSVAAAVVFPQVFFPSQDALTGTLLAFSTYAVGFVARPIGGFVFGRLGDIVGRKQILVITLMMAGAATVAIGLLPGHATIGVAAPLILVLLRLLQGVAVGGEWGGAVLLSSEYGNPRQRGFWASAAQIGSPMGTLLANGALALLAVSMDEAQFEAWGWRVAFLISAVLVAVGLWIRLRLEDTPIFKAMQQSGDRPAAPIREVVRTQKRALAAGMLVRNAPDILYAVYVVFVVTYGTQRLGFDRTEILVAVLIGCAFQLVVTPLAGALSDRVNRRLVYACAAVGGLVWTVVFFPLINGGSYLMLIIGVSVGLAFQTAMYGPQAAFITEQFPVRLRSTGSSLAYTVSAIIGGAFAPTILTALFSRYHSWIPLVGYVLFAVLVTLTGLLLGRDPDHSENDHYAQLAEKPTRPTPSAD